MTVLRFILHLSYTTIISAIPQNYLGARRTYRQT